MTKALALIFYENLLAGNQLLNRLSDLDYRTLVTSELGKLQETAAAERPIVILLEFGAMTDRVCGVIRSLRADPATQHIPLVAFTAHRNAKEAAQATAQGQTAGATLVVTDIALLGHLDQVLDQALRVD
jgi:CheY-like chemotaxis protein